MIICSEKGAIKEVEELSVDFQRLDYDVKIIKSFISIWNYKEFDFIALMDCLKTLP